MPGQAVIYGYETGAEMMDGFVAPARRVHIWLDDSSFLDLTEDGSTLAEHALRSPPVWNGMAAARGRLYLSTRDGRLLGFAPKGR